MKEMIRELKTDRTALLEYAGDTDEQRKQIERAAQIKALRWVRENSAYDKRHINNAIIRLNNGGEL